MEQYSLFQPQNILSVSQLTGYLRQLIEDDDLMQDLWVEGEISNFSRPSSGHLYFTLKDSQSAIRWGKASKGDDGAPEALALAVKATRYGCNWHGSHESYSKAAQNLLQSKFKSTSWAAATPYWFSCMYEEWDKDGNRVPNCKPKRWEKQAPLK